VAVRRAKRQLDNFGEITENDTEAVRMLLDWGADVTGLAEDVEALLAQ
jgi:hypothetical protein